MCVYIYICIYIQSRVCTNLKFVGGPRGPYMRCSDSFLFEIEALES